MLRHKLGHLSLPGTAGSLISVHYLMLDKQTGLIAEIVKLLNRRKEKLKLQEFFTEEHISFEADMTAALWRAAARFRLAADPACCASLKDIVPGSIHAAPSLDLHWADLMDTVSGLLAISQLLILF
jgi:hypothetical protein